MSSNYVRFWGVRGSYPAPFSTHMRIGGNTPCVEVRLGSKVLIFDAGTGVIPLGHELMKQSEIQEVNIILSHYHWDHISGLPFFAPAFMPGWKVDIFGPGDEPADLKSRLAAQMKAPYFPVETETWLAEVSYHTPHPAPVRIGELSIGSFILHHPGITYGYRLEVNGKTVVYAPDNELSFIDRSIEKRKAEFDQDEQTLLNDMKKEDKSRNIEFMTDVHMLIHDAQYTPEDYARKHGWGHSCFIDTVNSAIDAGVNHLFLFSHEPTYDDDQIDAMHRQTQELIKERGSSMVCHVSREGMLIDLED
jgi:phosphoribosyl 1,2-cyclic phosphodiesterase